MKPQVKTTPKELRSIDNFAKLLDTQFRIPFTSIEFGLDFIVGLVPYGGDIVTFVFSAGLVLAMARHGVSGNVIARMILNILIDTVVGGIPILGDIFDLFYKSNRRNYDLLEKHYQEGAYQGSAWRVVLPVLLILILIFLLQIFFIWKIFSMTWGVLF